MTKNGHFSLKTCVFSLKMCGFSLKTCVYVTSEGENKDYFRNLFRVISQNSKHVFFRVFYKYGNYCVIIEFLYSRKNRFDSDFNRIFE